jgi:hypothetical protein
MTNDKFSAFIQSGELTELAHAHPLSVLIVAASKPAGDVAGGSAETWRHLPYCTFIEIKRRNAARRSHTSSPFQGTGRIRNQMLTPFWH